MMTSWRIYLVSQVMIIEQTNRGNQFDFNLNFVQKTSLIDNKNKK